MSAGCPQNGARSPAGMWSVAGTGTLRLSRRFPVEIHAALPYAMMVEIEFDPAKDASNLVKHGVPLVLGLLILEESIGSVIDDRKDYGEIRANAFGLVRDRLYVCTYAIRGSVYRLISVRKASRQEQRIWLHSVRGPRQCC